MTDSSDEQIIGVLTAAEANAFNNLRARERALEATFESAFLNHMNIVASNQEDTEKAWNEVCERLGIDRDALKDGGESVRIEMRHAASSVVKFRLDGSWRR